MSGYPPHTEVLSISDIDHYDHGIPAGTVGGPRQFMANISMLQPTHRQIYHPILIVQQPTNGAILYNFYEGTFKQRKPNIC